MPAAERGRDSEEPSQRPGRGPDGRGHAADGPGAGQTHVRGVAILRSTNNSVTVDYKLCVPLLFMHFNLINHHYL